MSHTSAISSKKNPDILISFDGVSKWFDNFQALKILIFRSNRESVLLFAGLLDLGNQR